MEPKQSVNAYFELTIIELPKSATFTKISPLSSSTSIFSGFKSLWII
jgi:hypothetical protein